MNIFEALRVDHDIQRALLDQLVETSGDTKHRDHVFQAIKHELNIHADAEERFFYVPLINDDLTQEKSRHSIAEHHEIDEIIEKLEETEYDSSAWLKFAKQLKEKVEHHLDEEEHEVFQLAGKALKEKEKTALAKDYKNYIEEQRNL
ncbi:hemerythrin domain-containing protein [Lacinutrix neustonica]|uniref:Hemerythrin domain-containing protein n=1 Tax=Lacinutrix neustonica TaxID=2980107 RepID=A0A9E8SI17_9FLAO|nr:hemerythrin domain-containing protein [Lacinutrix neustonica]WAC03260.1 hemerythrin domain-containing protein [Lacinutrix neustonica]